MTPHIFKKRKLNHPPPKMTLPLTKFLYHKLPLKIPPPEKNRKSLSPLKNPHLLTKIRQPARRWKMIHLPPKKKKTDDQSKESKECENIWKAPPKIQFDVVDLLLKARAISSQVQEHGLLFNLEEVRLDQKKRTVSVFVVDKRSKKFVKPVKNYVSYPAWA